MLMKMLVYCFMQLMFAFKVDGISLFLNPPSMVIGSSNANPVTSLTIQCSSSATSNIDSVVQLKLSRRKPTETSFIGIASMRNNSVATLDPTVPSDIQTRLPNISGTFGTDLKSGTISLSISTNGLACTDGAEYQCSLSYIDRGGNNQTVTDNKNFTVITLTSEVLIDSPEYYGDKGNILKLRNNSVLIVGTRIKYRCTANVGSFPDGEIIWERSSEMRSMKSFIPYTPTQSTDVQEYSRHDGCSYRRTSTMYYNLTTLDKDGISFRCKVRFYLDGRQYETLANQHYITFSDVQECKPRKVEMMGSTNAVAIAGGSCAVAVVILVVVIFVWRKTPSVQKTSLDEGFNNSTQGRSEQTGNLHVRGSRSGNVSNTGYENIHVCETEASRYRTPSNEQKKSCSKYITRYPGTETIYLNTANTSIIGDKEYERLQLNQMETHPYMVYKGEN